MSDQNEKNLNQPEEGQDDFSSMSIDELIASTKEEIARIDQMMGTSRLPQQEDAQEPAPQQGAPQAGEVSLDDETDDKAKPSQPEPFEPKLPEEYADLSLDSDEQPEQDSGLSDQEPAGRTPAEGEEQPPDPSPAEGGDQPPYRPGDAAGEALRRQSYMRFSQEFPGIKPEEIPAEIWRDFAAGRGDLADLFARHENRQLKAQLAVARQNEENRRRSTGSRATAGSTVQSRLDADWYDGT